MASPSDADVAKSSNCGRVNGSDPTAGPHNDQCLGVIIKIDGYSDSSYVYGLKLYWENGGCVMHGGTSGTATTLDCTNDPVREIAYHCDDGNIRGLQFRTMSNNTMRLGKSPQSGKYVFSNPKDVFTDMVSYQGTQNNKTTIWGGTFYFVGPAKIDTSNTEVAKSSNCGRVNSSDPTAGPHNDRCLGVIIKIDGYSDSSYVYGMKLYWNNGDCIMHGGTSGTAKTLDCADDPVREIAYHCDDGKIRGLQFRTKSNNTMCLGKSPQSGKYVFSNPKDVFTDMVSYQGTQNNKTTIWGGTFYFVGPAKIDTSSTTLTSIDGYYREMGWPALAVLAHGTIVAKSLMNVGKLRRQLGIKAPSCDPPLTTSPTDSQLWYRTFRAQENCKETFLIYLPSILIASSLGYYVFGKWAPRIVGTLAFASAFQRYRYLNAYIEDADKRGKPFQYAHMFMRPVLLIAVMSAGYLFGQELYHWFMGCAKKCSKSEEEVEE